MKQHFLTFASDRFGEFDDILLAELQQSIDKYAPGLDIISVRITKPTIPQNIMKNFEQMEAEKSKLRVAIEAQKVAAKEAETERMKKRIEAETRAEVSKVEQAQAQLERESERIQSEIEDRKIANSRKTLADAAYYEAERRAAANKLLLSPEFIALESVRSVANNTKIFFGQSVNGMFAEVFQALGTAKN